MSRDTLIEALTFAISLIRNSVKLLCKDGRLEDAIKAINAGEVLLDFEEISPEVRLDFLISAASFLIKRYFSTKIGKEEMLSTIMMAIDEAKKINKTEGIAHTLSLKGQAKYYITINNANTLTASETDYEEALKLRYEIQDTRGICESLFYVGVIYERRGEYDVAQDYYLRAKTLAQEGNHSFEECEATRHLAGIAWYRGESENALLYAKEAMDLRLASGFKLYLPYDYILLGQILLQKGEEQKALQAYEEAKALSLDMDQKQSLLYSLLGLGDIQAKLQKKNDAVENYKDALILAEELMIPRAVNKAMECLEKFSEDNLG